MTPLEIKLMEELLIKEASKTKNNYRFARLVRISKELDLACTEYLIGMYNKEFKVEHKLENFLT